MKTLRIFPFALAWLLLWSATILASVVVYPFPERMKKADLIVEGSVESQQDLLFDRNDSRAFAKESVLRIEKVFKGKASAGEAIKIFTHRNFICDTSRKLREGFRYILMLQRHQDGYADVNYGSGMWEIVDLEPGRRYTVGELWGPTWGIEYETFLSLLAWHSREPENWPETPAVSKERARAIAERALAEAGTDLAGFQPAKEALIRIVGEIEGIARKGDPMWLFDWEKPEARGLSPRPKGSFAFCYVHAHTGAIHGSPGRIGVEPRLALRLFLETESRFRETYRGKAAGLRVGEIGEAEFRALVDRLDVLFLKVEPSYPEGSTYLLASPAREGDVPPAVAVVVPGGRLMLAGTVKR